MHSRTKNKTFGASLRSCLALLVASVSLAGCGTPVVVGQSKKADAYDTKLQHVLVALNLSVRTMTATNKNALMTLGELKQAINAKWVGLSIEFVDLDNEVEKVKALEAVASTTHPAQILELKTAAYETMSYALGGYTVDASLYDVTMKKVVWRTQVILKAFPAGRLRNGNFGARISHQDDANDVVDTLTVKLKSDGLL